MSDRELWMNFLRLSSSFSVFLFFFSFFFSFLTGWQVELGAKDVQGSARLSKCLLNNAEVPKGKKGKKEKKRRAPPPNYNTTLT